jgi:hypothetical protein
MKLIYTADGPSELYDLRQDWMEKIGLSESMPEKTDDLIRVYEQWLAKTPKAKTEQRDFTDAQKRSLRALGYLE